MKIGFACGAVALSILFTTTAALAQIDFSSPAAITGADNIDTNGSFVDALQTRPDKTSANDITIGTNLFDTGVYTNSNANFGDGTIVFSAGNSYLGGAGDSFNGTLTTGDASDNTAFRNVLAGTVYTEGLGSITLNNLKVGDSYEVQIFKPTDYGDNSRNTEFVGTNTVQIVTPSFTIGSFVAGNTSETFGFGKGVNGSYGEANAVILRDVTAVPEPSSFMAFGLGLAFLLSIGKLRKLCA